MEKNRKFLIIFIIIVVIVAIAFGAYEIVAQNFWKPDGNILEDGRVELIKKLKSIEDPTNRKEQVDFALESNLITQEQANELY